MVFKPSEESEQEAAVTAGSSPRLHRRVFEILAERITEGSLPAGTRLSETAVASHFGVSRAPARRALADLAGAGLLVRGKSRGYIVGGDGTEAALVGEETPALASGHQRLVSLASWERIYGEVESEIIARITFASWRVNEAELARHYEVSRTVARDVIARLQQRGIVRKDDRSRWLAPALSLAHVCDLYELRRLLEPAALLRAAPRLPEEAIVETRERLLAERERTDEVQGSTLDRLEQDLHVRLLAHCGSDALMQALALPQSLLIAFRFIYLWSPPVSALNALIPEHLEILDRLVEGRVEAAAEALVEHLQHSQDRTVTRIEAIYAAPPVSVALPYLDQLPVEMTEVRHGQV